MFDGAHLAEDLAGLVKEHEKVLVCRAAEGSPDLAFILAEHNVEFEDIPVYHTVSACSNNKELNKLFEDGAVDFVTFTSKSTVEGFVKSAEIDFSKVNGVCIGRQTADASEKYAIRSYISDEATIDSVIEKIVEVRANGTC